MLRLPPGVTRVVRASHVLVEGHKLVWMEDWILDRGPEGSWLAHAQLAERLHLSAETVEAYRRRLEWWGLYWRHPRPGARSPGWCPMIGKRFWPHDATPAGVTAAVVLLDAELRRRGAPTGISAVARADVMRRGVLPQEANRDSPESEPSSPKKRTVVPPKANGGSPEARDTSTAFDFDAQGERPVSTAVSSTGNRVGPHGPEAKAIEPALKLTLELIERRVVAKVLTREQADVERRRVLGL